MYLNLAQKLLDLLLRDPFHDHMSFNSKDNCLQFPLLVKFGINESNNLSTIAALHKLTLS